MDEKYWDCLDCQACTACAHSESECTAYSEFFEISLAAEKESADKGAAA